MTLVENLDAYLFDSGETCTIAGVAQVGIFDKAFMESMGIVSGNHPVLLIQDTALGSAAEGSAVVIRSTTYSIAAIEPDGTGMTTLRLEA